MLMPNPDYRLQTEKQHREDVCEPFVDHSSRKQLAGQVVLMLMFAVAILLRWLT